MSPVAGNKPRPWVSAWFLLTLPVILWDASYCFMRPRSMVGGDLHWFWAPYAIWEEVYGPPSFLSGDGFTNAQSLLNLIETTFNMVYLYLTHVNPSPAAPLVGFGAALTTLSKTILYWAQEYYCNYCAIGHNSVPNLIFWGVMNGLWLVGPFIVVQTLGKDLIHSLYVAARAEASTKKSKSK